MILSAQSIRNRRGMIEPFHNEPIIRNGMSAGLSAAGYDICVRESFAIMPGGFFLCSSIEHFNLPTDILMKIVDKSTLARLGIFVQNTVAEPGWRGYLTLEVTNQSLNSFYMNSGSPIAQVIFMLLDEPTDIPYDGKYQDQSPLPVEAII